MANKIAEDIDTKSRLQEDPSRFDIWLQRNLAIIRNLLIPDYANIYVDGSAIETVITVISTFVKITTFDTNGASYGSMPDQANSQIKVKNTGDYKITCAISLDGVGGSGATYRISAFINNGTTELSNVHGSLSIAGGSNKEMSLTIAGTWPLTKDDLVEVWVMNDTGTQNVIVEDISLTLELKRRT